MGLKKKIKELDTSLSIEIYFLPLDTILTYRIEKESRLLEY